MPMVLDQSLFKQVEMKVSYRLILDTSLFQFRSNICHSYMSNINQHILFSEYTIAKESPVSKAIAGPKDTPPANSN